MVPLWNPGSDFKIGHGLIVGEPAREIIQKGHVPASDVFQFKPLTYYFVLCFFVVYGIMMSCTEAPSARCQ